MESIKFNIDNDKLAQYMMNSQFMNYIQENKQMVSLVFVWFFTVLILYLIQIPYVDENKILKNEVDQHLETIENITMEKNNLESEIYEANFIKNELANKNADLYKSNFDLQNDIQELNLKISKLKEKNVILCESLEDFLSLRLKNRKSENNDDNIKNNEDNIKNNEDTHTYNLRSLKIEKS